MEVEGVSCAVDVDDDLEGFEECGCLPDFSILRRTLAMYSFANFLILAIFSSERASSFPSR